MIALELGEVVTCWALVDVSAADAGCLLRHGTCDTRRTAREVADAGGAKLALGAA